MKKLDYKKEFPDLYLPKKKPSLVEVPEMLFIQVEGKGNPNTSAAYADALELLYGLSYGIKMNLKFGAVPEDLLERTSLMAEPAIAAGNYVVPPLEGLWWQEEGAVFDGTNAMDKEKFCWISMIRQPDSITDELFAWAKEMLNKKKPELDCSKARLVRYTEGLCAQVLHVGAYDEEPATIAQLDRFVEEAGCELDFSDRFHHEIYLGDPRKTAPERLKTVIRHPVRRAGGRK